MKLVFTIIPLMFLADDVFGGRFHFNFSPQTLARFRFDVKGNSHMGAGAGADRIMNDLLSFNGFRTKFTAAGDMFKGGASAHENGGFNMGSSGFKNNKQFGNQDDEIGSAFGVMKKIDHFNNHQSMSGGNYQGLGANRLKGHNSGAGKKKTFYGSKVFKDNIVYGFGKTFDQDLNEVGGVKDVNGHDDHNLDEIIDNHKGNKKFRGDHAHSNSRKDGQNAFRNDHFNRHNGRHQSDDGKYANNNNRVDDVGNSADGQSVLSARGDSASHSGHGGHLSDKHNTNIFGVHDSNVGKHLSASHGGAQSHGDQTYYGGTGGHAGLGGGGTGSYHGRGNGGAADGSKGGHKSLSDQGNKHLLHGSVFHGSADKQFGNNNNKNDFVQSNNLQTSKHVGNSHGVHNGQSNGFFVRSGGSSKSVGDDVNLNAGASAHTSASGSNHNLGENASDKETYRRNRQDRKHHDNNNRQFYHDRNEKGTNKEHLTFKRDKGQNEVAATQAANNMHQTDFDMIHRSAKQDANSRSDHFNNAGKKSNDLASTVGKRRSIGMSNTQGTVFSKNKQQNFNQQKSTAESGKHSNHDDQKKRQNDGYENRHGATAAINNGQKQLHSNNNAGTDRGSSGPVSNSVDRKREAAAVAAIASIKKSTIFNDPPNFQQSGFREFGTFGSNGDFGGPRPNTNRRGKGGSFGNFETGSDFKSRTGGNSGFHGPISNQRRTGGGYSNNGLHGPISNQRRTGSGYRNGAIHGPISNQRRTGSGYSNGGFHGPISNQRSGGYGGNMNIHSGMFDNRMSSMFDGPLDMFKSKSKSMFTGGGFSSFDNGFGFGHN